MGVKVHWRIWEEKEGKTGEMRKVRGRDEGRGTDEKRGRKHLGKESQNEKGDEIVGGEGKRKAEEGEG